MRTLRHLLLIATAAIALSITQAFSQGWGFKIPLVIQDNGSGVDTLYFGFNSLATYCIDPTLGEFELPPKPPAGIFDTRFTDPRGLSECLGQGVKTNLHSKFSPTGTDTFQVDFQTGDGNTPFHFSWPSNLSSNFFYARLVDAFDGTTVNVDMSTDSSYTLSLPLSRLRIIGISVIDLAVREGNRIPKTFELSQNYPNPFNPTTSVKYAVEKTSLIQIAVYDLLGRKVATVVYEELSPGYYSSMWNGRGGDGVPMSSGVYYLRMTAFLRDGGSLNGSEIFNSSRKIVLTK